MYNTIDYDKLEGDYILVDLRSPGEYKEFTIPGALNLPIFDDEERKLIGTVYNHESIDKAKKSELILHQKSSRCFMRKFQNLRKNMTCWYCSVSAEA